MCHLPPLKGSVSEKNNVIRYIGQSRVLPVPFPKYRIEVQVLLTFEVKKNTHTQCGSLNEHARTMAERTGHLILISLHNDNGDCYSNGLHNSSQMIVSRF